jgi:cytochrome d ubiquinol oxidase subunit I
MVGAGMAMAAVALWAGWLVWRRQPLWDSPWFPRALVAAAPLGLIAIEAGWVVTEVGRQPWIIYGVMRTRDAITPMTHMAVPLVLFTMLYLLLAITVAYLLWRQVLSSPRSVEITRTMAAGS